MAKPMLSSNLRNMKFLQRVYQKEEKPVNEEQLVIPEGNFPPAAVKKCVVIMEGDPHPGATKGRMSFMNFNPAIDKLNDEASNSHQSDQSATFSGRHGESMSRRNISPKEASKNVAIKRKHKGEVSEAQYPNKSQRNFRGQKESSGQKQAKKEKLDWNVLRHPKSHGKKKR